MITLTLCQETLEQLNLQSNLPSAETRQGALVGDRFGQDTVTDCKTGWNTKWEPLFTALDQLKQCQQSGDTAMQAQALAELDRIDGEWQGADAMTQAVYVWILSEASTCLENATKYMRLAQDIADVRIRAARDVDGDTAAAVAAALMALPYKHMPRYIPAFLRHAYIYHARYWANIAAQKFPALTDAGRFFLQYGLQRLMDERKGYRW